MAQEPNEDVIGLIGAQNATWEVRNGKEIWLELDDVYIATAGTDVLAAYIVAEHNAVIARIELGAR